MSKPLALLRASSLLGDMLPDFLEWERGCSAPALVRIGGNRCSRSDFSRSEGCTQNPPPCFLDVEVAVAVVGSGRESAGDGCSSMGVMSLGDGAEADDEDPRGSSPIG